VARIAEPGYKTIVKAFVEKKKKKPAYVLKLSGEVCSIQIPI
jgi:hypothetical protein